jgi:hypothetical protein
LQRIGTKRGHTAIPYILKRQFMKYAIRYALVCMTLLLAGCKGEVCKDLNVLETTATLTWNGDYALDGCGYSIQIGENHYKPENESDIDESFKTEALFKGTSVKLTYSPGGRKMDVGCGMMAGTTLIDYVVVLAVEKL